MLTEVALWCAEWKLQAMQSLSYLKLSAVRQLTGKCVFFTSRTTMKITVFLRVKEITQSTI